VAELPRSADVVIAGAGLAGLTAARVLSDAGYDVAVLEAGDAPGGRVRTDLVDGFRLDRGFQLLNPSYPRVKRDVDLAALDLRPFEAGACVPHEGSRSVIGDPRRLPSAAISTLRFPVGSLREKLAVARAGIALGYGSADRIKRQPDASLAAALDRRGVTGPLREGVIRRYLAGVLGDLDLETSATFGELLIRSFVRGVPAIPATGMQALSDQLAARLRPGVLHLNTTVTKVTTGRVETAVGAVAATAVLVATDPRTSARLLGQAEPVMRGLTTFYFHAPTSPTSRALLHVDSRNCGPLVNTAVISNAAPSYAAHGALVAATALGGEVREELYASVPRHAQSLYGASTRDWELIRVYPIPDALPAMPPGTALQRPVDLGDRMFVAGDHRDTASIQGAMVSGHRAAAAVVRTLQSKTG
jgi:monoamine oxidase